MCCMLHGIEHSAHIARPEAASAAGNESVLDVLRRRYALGEISREQREEMKRVWRTTEGAAMTASEDHVHHQKKTRSENRG